MSVNERASLETTRAPFPSSFCAESRPTCDRPVTRTRAPIHEHLPRHEPYAARAAIITSAMQVISYAMVTNNEKRARGRPKGFIPDEALEPRPALLQDNALKDAG